jgi:hypothetical protein
MEIRVRANICIAGVTELTTISLQRGVPQQKISSGCVAESHRNSLSRTVSFNPATARTRVRGIIREPGIKREFIPLPLAPSFSVSLISFCPNIRDGRIFIDAWKLEHRRYPRARARFVDRGG